MMRIATCQYQLEALDWNAYVKKITSLVLKAKKQNAKLLLLPEYAGIEMGGIHDNDSELFAAIQPLLPDYINFYKQLACQYEIYLQPGTILVEASAGKYFNRAYLFNPNGQVGYQDKLQLIEFEKNSQIIARGTHQTLFETEWGKIGIAICYDSEFPEIVRNLVNAGAALILVPSYTSSLAGYHRVMLSARARAIENQCYVAVSFIVGKVNLGTDVQEQTVGKAAIFGPADTGFPEDGIIKQGFFNKEAMIVGDIEIDKLFYVREQGQVRQFEDAKYCAHYEIINDQ